jgi:hypothetical protein
LKENSHGSKEVEEESSEEEDNQAQDEESSRIHETCGDEALQKSEAEGTSEKGSQKSHCGRSTGRREPRPFP